MRLMTAFVLVAILLFGCGYSAPTTSPTPPEVQGIVSRPVVLQDPGSILIAYVVNQNSDDVIAIDVIARSVVGRAPTGRNPHEIVGSPDGSRLFTSDQAGGTISVFDSASLQL